MLQGQKTVSKKKKKTANFGLRSSSIARNWAKKTKKNPTDFVVKSCLINDRELLEEEDKDGEKPANWLPLSMARRRSGKKLLTLAWSLAWTMTRNCSKKKIPTNVGAMSCLINYQELLQEEE